MRPSFLNNLFDAGTAGFEQLAIDIFRYQYGNNVVYRDFCNAVGKTPDKIAQWREIPFLPIRFFKSHRVICGNADEQILFESSGTTQQTTSRHYVADLSIYEKSFERGFEMFYGQPSGYVILGLLPSYLERSHSSLVYMVQRLMDKSGRTENAFFLHDHAALAQQLEALELAGQKTMLIGVTYALLDFAAHFPMPLTNTIVMETGGMKGRKKEMLREEVHEQIRLSFGVPSVHSEYGMTELLSQAYSRKDGYFFTPPWMKIAVRDEDDPMQVAESGRGAINVIDFANIYSCSFIATDDAGQVFSDGSFKVLGRLDQTDIRGCSLLAL